MFSFVLIFGDQDGEQRIRRSLESLGRVQEESGGRFVATAAGGPEDGWIAYQPLSTIEDDFERQEIDALKRSIPVPKFALIEGRDEPKAIFSSSFIIGLSMQGTALVDNDHGMVATLEVVQRLAQSGVQWLYLKDSPHCSLDA
jgi:hypothetical protein